MSNLVKETPLQVVYVVTCYQNIVGVYASQQDAATAQNDLVNKNRPADVLCRQIIYPLNPSKS